MSELKAGILIGALAVAVPVGLIVASVVHFGYAKRGKIAAEAGLKIAKKIYWARLGNLVRLGVLAAILLALAWVIAQGPQEGPHR